MKISQIPIYICVNLGCYCGVGVSEYPLLGGCEEPGSGALAGHPV